MFNVLESILCESSLRSQSPVKNIDDDDDSRNTFAQHISQLTQTYKTLHTPQNVVNFRHLAKMRRFSFGVLKLITEKQPHTHIFNEAARIQHSRFRFLRVQYICLLHVHICGLSCAAVSHLIPIVKLGG